MSSKFNKKWFFKNQLVKRKIFLKFFFQISFNSKLGLKFHQILLPDNVLKFQMYFSIVGWRNSSISHKPLAWHVKTSNKIMKFRDFAVEKQKLFKKIGFN